MDPKGFFITPAVDTPPGSPLYAAFTVSLFQEDGTLIAKDVRAVVDTGAQWSAIDIDLITKAGLKPVRELLAHSATGKDVPVYMYKAQFAFGDTKHVTYVLPFPMKSGGQLYSALIGMDIIGMFSSLEIGVPNGSVALHGG